MTIEAPDVIEKNPRGTPTFAEAPSKPVQASIAPTTANQPTETFTGGILKTHRIVTPDKPSEPPAFIPKPPPMPSGSVVGWNGEKATAASSFVAPDLSGLKAPDFIPKPQNQYTNPLRPDIDRLADNYAPPMTPRQQVVSPDMMETNPYAKQFADQMRNINRPRHPDARIKPGEADQYTQVESMVKAWTAQANRPDTPPEVRRQMLEAVKPYSSQAATDVPRAEDVPDTPESHQAIGSAAINAINRAIKTRGIAARMERDRGETDAGYFNEVAKQRAEGDKRLESLLRESGLRRDPETGQIVAGPNYLQTPIASKLKLLNEAIAQQTYHYQRLRDDTPEGQATKAQIARGMAEDMGTLKAFGIAARESLRQSVGADQWQQFMGYAPPDTAANNQAMVGGIQQAHPVASAVGGAVGTIPRMTVETAAIGKTLAPLKLNRFGPLVEHAVQGGTFGAVDYGINAGIQGHFDPAEFTKSTVAMTVLPIVSSGLAKMGKSMAPMAVQHVIEDQVARLPDYLHAASRAGIDLTAEAVHQGLSLATLKHIENMAEGQPTSFDDLVQSFVTGATFGVTSAQKTANAETPYPIREVQRVSAENAARRQQVANWIKQATANMPPERMAEARELAQQTELAARGAETAGGRAAPQPAPSQPEDAARVRAMQESEIAQRNKESSAAAEPPQFIPKPQASAESPKDQAETPASEPVKEMRHHATFSDREAAEAEAKRTGGSVVGGINGGFMVIAPPKEAAKTADAQSATIAPVKMEEGAGRTSPHKEPQATSGYKPAKESDLNGRSIHLWHGTTKKAWERISKDLQLQSGERGKNAAANVDDARQYPEDTGAEVLVVVRADTQSLSVDPNDQIGDTVKEGLFPDKGYGSSATLGKHEIVAAFDVSGAKKGYEKALQRGDFERAKRLGVKQLFEQSGPADSGATTPPVAQETPVKAPEVAQKPVETPKAEPVASKVETPKAETPAPETPAAKPAVYKQGDRVFWGNNKGVVLSDSPGRDTVRIRKELKDGTVTVNVKRGELSPHTAEGMGLKVGDYVQYPGMEKDGPYRVDAINPDGSLDLFAQSQRGMPKVKADRVFKVETPPEQSNQSNGPKQETTNAIPKQGSSPSGLGNERVRGSDQPARVGEGNAEHREAPGKGAEEAVGGEKPSDGKGGAKRPDEETQSGKVKQPWEMTRDEAAAWVNGGKDIGRMSDQEVAAARERASRLFGEVNARVDSIKREGELKGGLTFEHASWLLDSLNPGPVMQARREVAGQQPWQRKASEFARDYGGEKTPSPTYTPPNLESLIASGDVVKTDRGYKAVTDAGKEAIRKANDEATGFQHGLMSHAAQESERLRRMETGFREHRRSVEQAAEEGKIDWNSDVGMQHAKDYPDLAAKYAKGDDASTKVSPERAAYISTRTRLLDGMGGTEHAILGERGPMIDIPAGGPKKAAELIEQIKKMPQVEDGMVVGNRARIFLIDPDKPAKSSKGESANVQPERKADDAVTPPASEKGETKEAAKAENRSVWRQMDVGDLYWIMQKRTPPDANSKHVFVAGDESLALGQGKNSGGPVVELDPSTIKLYSAPEKPGSGFVRGTAGIEPERTFYWDGPDAKGTTGEDIFRSIRSVTFTPDQLKQRGAEASAGRIADRLNMARWGREVLPDGRVRYTPPRRDSLSESSTYASSPPESTGAEAKDAAKAEANSENATVERTTPRKYTDWQVSEQRREQGRKVFRIFSPEAGDSVTIKEDRKGEGTYSAEYSDGVNKKGEKTGVVKIFEGGLSKERAIAAAKNFIETGKPYEWLTPEQKRDELKPLEDHKATRARGFNGNTVADDVPFVTDGHTMLRRDAISANTAAGLPKNEVIRQLPKDTVQKYWDDFTKKATTKLEPLGQRESESGGHLAYLQMQGRKYQDIMVVNADKLKWAMDVTKADGFRVDPNGKAKPVVLYKGDNPVGMVMPVNSEREMINWAPPKSSKGSTEPIPGPGAAAESEVGPKPGRSTPAPEDAPKAVAATFAPEATAAREAEAQQKILAGNKDTITKLREFGMSAVDSARRYAGKTFPTLTRFSPESGEAGATLIASKEMAKYQGEALGHKVLDAAGIDAKDESTRRKLGAVLSEDNLRGVRQKFMDRAAEARAKIDAIENATDRVDELLKAREEIKDEDSTEAKALRKEINREIGYYKRIEVDQIFADSERAKHEATATDAEEQAKNVRTLVGAEESPFKTEDEYRALLRDPKINAAITAHRQFVNPRTEENYRLSKQIDPDVELPRRGADTNTHMSLKAILDEPDVSQTKLPAGGNLRNTLRKHSPFEREAFGTAEKYETDYLKLVEHSFQKGTLPANQARFYKTLVDSGLAVIGKPGDTPTIDGKPTRGLDLKRSSLVTDGGIVPRNEVLYVRDDVYREVRNALSIDRQEPGPTFRFISNLHTQTALLSGVEAISHAANHFAVMFKAPLMKGEHLPDWVVNAPVGRIAGILDAVGTKAVKMLMGDQAVREELAKLAEIGALKPHSEHRGSKWNPTTYMSKTIEHLAAASRLVLNDGFDRIVRADVGVEDTPTARRDYVNQVGQYHKEAQASLVRAVRDYLIGSFATAGSTFHSQALRTATLDPGVKAEGLKNQAMLRALSASQFVGTLGMVALVNYMRSGQLQPKGTTWGSLYLGDDEQGRPRSIDVADIIGLKRAARATGAEGFIQGMMDNATPSQMLDSSVKKAASAAISPYMGPMPTAATIGMTGYSPHGFNDVTGRVAPGESQSIANVKSALLHANPSVGTTADKTSRGERASDILLGQFGKFAPRTGKAPENVPASQAESFLREVARTKASSVTPRGDEREKKKTMGELLVGVKRNAETGKAAVDRAVMDGKINADEAERIVKQGGMDPVAWHLQRVGAKDSAKAYGYMTPDQRETYGAKVADRIASSSLKPNEQDALYKQSGITPPQDLAIQRLHKALQDLAHPDTNAAAETKRLRDILNSGDLERGSKAYNKVNDEYMALQGRARGMSSEDKLMHDRISAYMNAKANIDKQAELLIRQGTMSREDATKWAQDRKDQKYKDFTSGNAPDLRRLSARLLPAGHPS